MRISRPKHANHLFVSPGKVEVYTNLKKCLEFKKMHIYLANKHILPEMFLQIFLHHSNKIHKALV